MRHPHQHLILIKRSFLLFEHLIQIVPGDPSHSKGGVFFPLRGEQRGEECRNIRMAIRSLFGHRLEDGLIDMMRETWIMVGERKRLLMHLLEGQRVEIGCRERLLSSK